MRKVALDDTTHALARFARSVDRDLRELIERINAADKPADFPRTDVKHSRSLPRPIRVKRGEGVGLALAVVLDMLDSGDLSLGELLARCTRLSETAPVKAEAIARTRRERREENKLLGD